MRRVALAVDQAIVLATPVDTGRARSNWLVTVGSPSGRTREPYAPGERLGRGEQANAAGALDQARKAVATHSNLRDIWVVNNVDYIGKLNAGSSRQAPPNFVRLGISAGIAEAKRIRALKRGN